MTKIGKDVVDDNNNVTINQRKSVVNKYPEGCISNLKKKFKIGKTRTIYHVPINRFEEMAEYQSRIENTRLAKINRSKQQFTNFQTFDEYITSQSSK